MKYATRARSAKVFQSGSRDFRASTLHQRPKLPPQSLSLKRGAQHTPSYERRVVRASTLHQRPKEPPATEGPKPRRRRARADPWNRRRRAASQISRPPAPTHSTCRICCEELPLDAFIKRRSFSSVEVPFQCVPHLSRWPQKKREPVCKSCIGRYISARIDTVGARNVYNGCLEPGCNAKWDHDYIMKYLPLNSLEDYNFGMLNLWKEKNTLFTCLHRECGATGILDSSAHGYPEVACADCSIRFCAFCKVPWHKGVTCGDFRLQKALIDKEMTDQERETVEMMRKTDARRCPECYIIIEKDGGCSHMYCTACRKSFDWAGALNAIPGAPAPERAQVDGPRVLCELDGLNGMTLRSDGLGAVVLA